MASSPPPQFGTLIPDGSVPMEEPMRPLPASFSSSSSSSSPSSSSSSSSSFSPSLLIIAAILAFVILSSASIYLLIRLFSRSSSSASASTRVSHSDSISSSGDNGAAAAASSGSDERDKAELIINSLPLFTLASSLAAVPKSSPDCAVCLSPFEPHADLRLLPACRHAFHAQCIDTWLRSTPSCPLCRASISLPVPPPPPPPPHPEDPSSAAGSGSFRVEIGSISRRRTPSSSDIETLAPPPHLRSYSIGSFDYLVEEEVEAVVSRIARRTKEKAPPPSAPPAPYIAVPPGEEVAEAAGGRGGGSRGSWLRDYVDRITSSASSSFNSLRFSGRWSARWSHRFDDGGGGGGGGGGGADSWWLDMEANNQLQREPEEPAYYAFYRWLVGV